MPTILKFKVLLIIALLLGTYVYADAKTYRFNIPNLEYDRIVEFDYYKARAQIGSVEYVFKEDSRFGVITLTSLFKFTEAFNDFQMANCTYEGDAFDCDNFAELYKSFAALAAQQNIATKDAQPFIGLIKVFQGHSWGGVQSGGWHMLIIAKTELGWVVIEPQNGEVVPLREYPNARFIDAIFF